MRLAIWIGHFWRDKVEAESVGTRLEVYERFEVRVAHRPLCGREVVLMVVERHSAVHWLIWVCALPEDQEHFLVDLVNCQ